MTATPSGSTRTRRKILAVLAGGLVLGVGAAITLAAWNDSEFATGTFTAGSFNLEGSTTSATTGFAEHATTGTAATLSFTAPFSNLSPGDIVYAPFWVRLDKTTTNNATFVASGLTASGTNATHIAYSVYSIAPAATCDASATSGTLVTSGANLSTFAAGGPSVALTKGTPPTVAGTAAQLCFVITAASQATLVPGGTATATWSFQATSN